MTNINYSRVDIVITVFNRIEKVGRTIVSALEALKDTGGQVIVVDDHSSDGTLEYLQQTFSAHSSVSILQHSENQGVTAAKNTGFQNSTADWVFFLDSDDLLLEEEFKRGVATLEAHSDCPIVFFRCVDQGGNFVGTVFENERKLSLQEYIAHTSYGEVLTVVNKALVKSLPYDSELRGYEGLGCARLIKKYGNALLSTIVLRVYDQSGEDRLSCRRQFWKRAGLLAKGHFRFFKEFYDDMSFYEKGMYLIKFSTYFLISILSKPFLSCRIP